MDQVDKQSNPGRAGKHGLFTLLPKRFKLDKRTKFGRAVSQLRNALVDDLGGDLSIQESLILDRIIFKTLKLCSYEAHSLKGNDSSMKVYLAMANSLRLDLQALGIERRLREITPLAAQLATLEAKAEQEKGNNGHG